jgi:4-hydroxy-L-threonine phosphate dehydrogenase PdxA
MTQLHTLDKPRIGITLGDLNGIGPEVIIKALADHRLLNLMTPVIYGSTKVLSFYRKMMNLEEFNYSQVKTKGQFFPKAINVVNCWDEVIEINPGQPSRQTAQSSLALLEEGS